MSNCYSGHTSLLRMGSKGRIPPPHLRRALPGPGMVHPDQFGPGILPPPGPFPHFDMLPPPEIMEQKLAAQHVEMQRLGTENQRLATTHGTLRQELAAAQHELQILHAQIGAIKSDREQQMRSLMDKIAKMEAELQAAEPVKVELQQAHTEAQNLVLAREELMSKVHQLNQDLQRAHVDVQQIPALMGELESLRQEYQHCRATFDYEKKFYNDHLESLQVMEKNYMTMAREVEKLRAELMNAANVDRRTVGQYGGATGNSENEASAHPVGQNAYEDGYVIHQYKDTLQSSPSHSSAYFVRHGPLPSAATGANAGVGAAVYVGAQSGPAPRRTGYEVPRGPAYDTSKGPGYDASRGPGYESQRGPSYDAQRGSGYDGQRGHAYDAQRGGGYETQRGSVNDASRGATYDAPARSLAVLHGQAAPPNNGPYGSATPPARAGSGYEAPSRGGNPVRR
ncbi:Sarcolemmal membrane-associated protein, putative isoform 1 [Theobroma cacao]|uniref:Sarcolemmal membrane-associated protein, putative isoform 1 n=2 Tax=Theobroma cacao TaxID=3641 RepID=A0A061EPT5_THECC|nr:Sarcolemmal membrane-associated protein, putative isoform 1 [Theobroma cacao]